MRGPDESHRGDVSASQCSKVQNGHLKRSFCQQVTNKENSSAAQSEPLPTALPDDLQALAALWPRLDDAGRTAVLAMVKALVGAHTPAQAKTNES
jgi:hypothetical protein